MTNVKINNVNDPDKLLNIIETCEGDVLLVTPEGDRLNMKSTLCKYVATAKLFGTPSDIQGMELEVAKEADAMKLVNFMMQG